MNEQVDDTCLGTRERSLSNLWCRGWNCLEDEIDKDRELLQEVGTGIYTVAPCAQTTRTDHIDKYLEQKKPTCGKEKNQKRKTLAKKERRVSQLSELMWVVGKKGITIVRLRIETI